MWGRRKAGSGDRADDACAFHDYIQDIKKSGTWEGYLECYAAAAALKRPLYMVDDGGEITLFPFDGPKSAHPIALFFNGAGHYEALTGPSSMWGQLQAYPQRHQAQRKKIGWG